MSSEADIVKVLNGLSNIVGYIKYFEKDFNNLRVDETPELSGILQRTKRLVDDFYSHACNIKELFYTNCILLSTKDIDSTVREDAESVLFSEQDKIDQYEKQSLEDIEHGNYVSIDLTENVDENSITPESKKDTTDSIDAIENDEEITEESQQDNNDCFNDVFAMIDEDLTIDVEKEQHIHSESEYMKNKNNTNVISDIPKSVDSLCKSKTSIVEDSSYKEFENSVSEDNQSNNKDSEPNNSTSAIGVLAKVSDNEVDYSTEKFVPDKENIQNEAREDSEIVKEVLDIERDGIELSEEKETTDQSTEVFANIDNTVTKDADKQEKKKLENTVDLDNSSTEREGIVNNYIHEDVSEEVNLRETEDELTKTSSDLSNIEEQGNKKMTNSLSDNSQKFGDTSAIKEFQEQIHDNDSMEDMFASPDNEREMRSKEKHSRDQIRIVDKNITEGDEILITINDSELEVAEQRERDNQSSNDIKHTEDDPGNVTTAHDKNNLEEPDVDLVEDDLTGGNVVKNITAGDIQQEENDSTNNVNSHNITNIINSEESDNANNSKKNWDEVDILSQNLIDELDKDVTPLINDNLDINNRQEENPDSIGDANINTENIDYEADTSVDNIENENDHCDITSINDNLIESDPEKNCNKAVDIEVIENDIEEHNKIENVIVIDDDSATDIQSSQDTESEIANNSAQSQDKITDQSMVEEIDKDITTRTDDNSVMNNQLEQNITGENQDCVSYITVENIEDTFGHCDTTTMNDSLIEGNLGKRYDKEIEADMDIDVGQDDLIDCNKVDNIIVIDDDSGTDSQQEENDSIKNITAEEIAEIMKANGTGSDILIESTMSVDDINIPVQNVVDLLGKDVTTTTRNDDFVKHNQLEQNNDDSTDDTNIDVENVEDEDLDIEIVNTENESVTTVTDDNLVEDNPKEDTMAFEFSQDIIFEDENKRDKIIIIDDDSATDSPHEDNNSTKNVNVQNIDEITTSGKVNNLEVDKDKTITTNDDEKDNNDTSEDNINNDKNLDCESGITVENIQNDSDQVAMSTSNDSIEDNPKKTSTEAKDEDISDLEFFKLLNADFIGKSFAIEESDEDNFITNDLLSESLKKKDKNNSTDDIEKVVLETENKTSNDSITVKKSTKRRKTKRNETVELKNLKVLIKDDISKIILEKDQDNLLNCATNDVILISEEELSCNETHKQKRRPKTDSINEKIVEPRNESGITMYEHDKDYINQDIPYKPRIKVVDIDKLIDHEKKKDLKIDEAVIILSSSEDESKSVRKNNKKESSRAKKGLKRKKHFKPNNIKKKKQVDCNEVTNENGNEKLMSQKNDTPSERIISVDASDEEVIVLPCKKRRRRFKKALVDVKSTEETGSSGNGDSIQSTSKKKTVDSELFVNSVSLKKKHLAEHLDKKLSNEVYIPLPQIECNSLRKKYLKNKEIER